MATPTMLTDDILIEMAKADHINARRSRLFRQRAADLYKRRLLCPHQTSASASINNNAVLVSGGESSGCAMGINCPYRHVTTQQTKSISAIIPIDVDDGEHERLPTIGTNSLIRWFWRENAFMYGAEPCRWRAFSFDWETRLEAGFQSVHGEKFGLPGRKLASAVSQLKYDQEHERSRPIRSPLTYTTSDHTTELFAGYAIDFRRMSLSTSKDGGHRRPIQRMRCASAPQWLLVPYYSSLVLACPALQPEAHAVDGAAASLLEMHYSIGSRSFFITEIGGTPYAVDLDRMRAVRLRDQVAVSLARQPMTLIRAGPASDIYGSQGLSLTGVFASREAQALHAVDFGGFAVPDPSPLSAISDPVILETGNATSKLDDISIAPTEFCLAARFSHRCLKESAASHLWRYRHRCPYGTRAQCYICCFGSQSDPSKLLTFSGITNGDNPLEAYDLRPLSLLDRPRAGHAAQRAKIHCLLFSHGDSDDEEKERDQVPISIHVSQEEVYWRQKQCYAKMVRQQWDPTPSPSLVPSTLSVLHNVKFPISSTHLTTNLRLEPLEARSSSGSQVTSTDSVSDGGVQEGLWLTALLEGRNYIEEQVQPVPTAASQEVIAENPSNVNENEKKNEECKLSRRRKKSSLLLAQAEKKAALEAVAAAAAAAVNQPSSISTTIMEGRYTVRVQRIQSPVLLDRYLRARHEAFVDILNLVPTVPMEESAGYSDPWSGQRDNPLLALSPHKGLKPRPPQKHSSFPLPNKNSPVRRRAVFSGRGSFDLLAAKEELGFAVVTRAALWAALEGDCTRITFHTTLEAALAAGPCPVRIASQGGDAGVQAIGSSYLVPQTSATTTRGAALFSSDEKEDPGSKTIIIAVKYDGLALDANALNSLGLYDWTSQLSEEDSPHDSRKSRANNTSSKEQIDAKDGGMKDANPSTNQAAAAEIAISQGCSVPCNAWNSPPLCPARHAVDDCIMEDGKRRAVLKTTPRLIQFHTVVRMTVDEVPAEVCELNDGQSIVTEPNEAIDTNLNQSDHQGLQSAKGFLSRGVTNVLEKLAGRSMQRHSPEALLEDLSRPVQVVKSVESTHYGSLWYPAYVVTLSERTLEKEQEVAPPLQRRRSSMRRTNSLVKRSSSITSLSSYAGRRPTVTAVPPDSQVPQARPSSALLRHRTKYAKGY